MNNNRNFELYPPNKRRTCIYLTRFAVQQFKKNAVKPFFMFIGRLKQLKWDFYPDTLEGNVIYILCLGGFFNEVGCWKIIDPIHFLKNWLHDKTRFFFMRFSVRPRNVQQHFVFYLQYIFISVKLIKKKIKYGNKIKKFRLSNETNWEYLSVPS